MQENTKTEVETCSSPEVVNIVNRFAWGNENLKTWFITKSNKAFLPKGSRLLFKLDCKPTNESTSITDTYPKIGHIISDVDDYNLKVVDVKSL